MVRTCRRRPLHLDPVRLLHEADDVARAAHLDTEGARAVSQHGFNG
jgi:hypothetical protein